MRLRFTIRDLLWLTALVALAVGWWLDHHRSSKNRFQVSDGGSVLTIVDSQTDTVLTMPTDLRSLNMGRDLQIVGK